MEIKPSKDEITSFISELVIKELNLKIDPESELDLQASFLYLGMTSIAALSIIGQIEDHYHLNLPESVLWDTENAEMLIENLYANFDKYLASA